MTEPTHTQEDYLRAIYLLAVAAGGPVKSGDVATKLGLSKSTITQRLQGLSEKGWIQQRRYGPVALTDEGMRLGKNLTYKHRLIEHFLVQVLEMPKGKVHEEAHRLEHAFSDDLTQKLADYLGNPTKCPHGGTLPEFEPLQ